MQFFVPVLAVSLYAAAILSFGRRAGVSDFVANLLSWPSVSKWFIGYSVLYFTGAVLIAFSIPPRTTQVFPYARRTLCIFGILALTLGGLALYTVLDSLVFKLSS